MAGPEFSGSELRLKGILKHRTPEESCLRGMCLKDARFSRQRLAWHRGEGLRVPFSKPKVVATVEAEVPPLASSSEDECPGPLSDLSAESEPEDPIYQARRVSFANRSGLEGPRGFHQTFKPKVWLRSRQECQESSPGDFSSQPPTPVETFSAGSGLAPLSSSMPIHSLSERKAGRQVDLPEDGEANALVDGVWQSDSSRHCLGGN